MENDNHVFIDGTALYEYVKSRCKGCDNYNGLRCRACPTDDELSDIQDFIDSAEEKDGD